MWQLSMNQQVIYNFEVLAFWVTNNVLGVLNTLLHLYFKYIYIFKVTKYLSKNHSIIYKKVLKTNIFVIVTKLKIVWCIENAIMNIQ